MHSLLCCTSMPQVKLIADSLYSVCSINLTSLPLPLSLSPLSAVMTNLDPSRGVTASQIQCRLAPLVPAIQVRCALIGINTAVFHMYSLYRIQLHSMI